MISSLQEALQNKKYQEVLKEVKRYGKKVDKDSIVNSLEFFAFYSMDKKNSLIQRLSVRINNDYSNDGLIELFESFGDPKECFVSIIFKDKKSYITNYKLSTGTEQQIICLKNELDSKVCFFFKNRENVTYKIKKILMRIIK